MKAISLLGNFKFRNLIPEFETILYVASAPMPQIWRLALWQIYTVTKQRILRRKA